MPEIISDIVDVYVFRRLNARVQFLLLQRRPDVAMPQTWQGFHAQIESTETTLDAARRAVREMAGLTVSAVYSADYVNQFYDDYRDVLVLAPVIAVNVSPQAPVSLGEDFRDCAWLDRDDATIRLPFSGQRWAVRHIDELMSIGEREAELYRLQLPDETAPETIVPQGPEATEPEEPLAIAETYDEVAKPSDPTSNDFPVLSSSSFFMRQREEPATASDEPSPESEVPASRDTAEHPPTTQPAVDEPDSEPDDTASLSEVSPERPAQDE